MDGMEDNCAVIIIKYPNSRIGHILYADEISIDEKTETLAYSNDGTKLTKTTRFILTAKGTLKAFTKEEDLIIYGVNHAELP